MHGKRRIRSSFFMRNIGILFRIQKRVDFIVVDVLRSIEGDMHLSVSLRSITRKRGLAYGTLVEKQCSISDISEKF
mgnify:FL=1